MNVTETIQQIERIIVNYDDSPFMITESEDGYTSLYWKKSTDMLTIDIEDEGNTLYAHSVDLAKGKYVDGTFTGVFRFADLEVWLKEKRLDVDVS